MHNIRQQHAHTRKVSLAHSPLENPYSTRVSDQSPDPSPTPQKKSDSKKKQTRNFMEVRTLSEADTLKQTNIDEYADKNTSHTTKY